MNAFDDTDVEDPLVMAVKEFTQVIESGQAISVDSFLEKYTDIADDLRPALEGLLMLHGAGESVASPTKSSDQEFVGQPVGDFQILSELGRGGMGIVYEALQLSLGRKVALKVLPFASALDEVRLQRFRNEAHAAAALHHTNIVPVYAVGCDRGVHYFAMQLIDGETLAELTRRLRLDMDVKSNSSAGASRSGQTPIDQTRPARSSTQGTFPSSHRRTQHYRRTVKMIVEAALAIEHAHAYGVIHRDIKPGNLIRDRMGKVWVTDFGLAQVESEASHLTRTGDAMGTLRYMSPEQASGNRLSLDHRTDIYSLGITLYELLVLRPAFDGENYRTLLNAVVDKDPPPASTIDPGLPSELDTIIRKAIAKSPADRYQSAREFADDLQRWLDDKPITARPPTAIERLSKWRRRNSGLVAAASAILLVSTIALAGTTFFVWRQQRITSLALQSETRERFRAEASLAQARAVVDTFSELSEQELAYRPDTQDLRRQFLETSLGFYQDLLSQSADDEELSKQIKQTAAKVTRLVDELQILENVQPMLLLNDPNVHVELQLDDEDAEALLNAVEQFRQQREQLANQQVGGLLSENEAISNLLHRFDSFVQSELLPHQMLRLKQINRQRWLPFTFKTREVIRELELTREQSVDISRIIEETRPSRFRRRGEHGDFQNPNRGPAPPSPPDADHGEFPNPSDRPPEDRRRTAPHPMIKGPPLGTDYTVSEIEKILTPSQLERWKALVGEPFEFRRD
ncbi:serine/threonine protein kinase [Rhodopirellula sp. MGV]|uniref:serine/threonine protein kinase n=1 Tax=Rhodopirellula sp. MGV TaxID=2023130 RepID=UPI000B96DA3F|nr:serine/threonine-protein kinase [Rhodopirellula sp. MGV]OYP33911.1 protein kinase [Rhodopirellula sp. MGV]PNY34107.1 serine/threonine protein kinase [Rhodopirellula baltica]